MPFENMMDSKLTTNGSGSDFVSSHIYEITAGDDQIRKKCKQKNKK